MLFQGLKSSSLSLKCSAQINPPWARLWKTKLDQSTADLNHLPTALLSCLKRADAAQEKNLWEGRQTRWQFWSQLLFFIFVFLRNGGNPRGAGNEQHYYTSNFNEKQNIRRVLSSKSEWGENRWQHLGLILLLFCLFCWWWIHNHQL